MSAVPSNEPQKKASPESLRLHQSRMGGVTIKRWMVSAFAFLIALLLLSTLWLQDGFGHKDEAAPMPLAHQPSPFPPPLPKGDYRALTKAPPPPPPPVQPPVRIAMPATPPPVTAPAPKRVDPEAERRRLALEKEREEARRSRIFFANPGAGTPGNGTFTDPNRVIPAATSIPARLITPIDSNVAGPVLAEVTSPVFGQGPRRELLIPRGARILGRYQGRISYGQARLPVQWEQLILPGSRSLALKDLATLDEEGYSGLRGKVDNHYDRLFASGLLTSALSAGAYYAGGGDDNPIGQAVASSAVQTGSRVIDRELDASPTLTIAAATRFTIMVTRDLHIPR